MTTLEQLDQLIMQAHAGEHMMPQTDDEQLTTQIIELAKSFKLNTAFDTALLEQIEQQPRIINNDTTARYRILSRIATSAAAVVLIFLAFLTITPLQTFAQEIIRQIGTFILTDGNPENQPTVPADQQEGEPLVSVSDAAAASEAIGFAVYVPEYEGIGRPIYYALPNDHPNYVVTDYRSYRRSTSMLTIFQWRSDDNAPRDEFSIGDTEIRDVMVNGLPAVWVEQLWGGAENYNHLMWEQDGFTFGIQSVDLPLEEVIAVAESMSPFTASE